MQQLQFELNINLLKICVMHYMINSQLLDIIV